MDKIIILSCSIFQSQTGPELTATLLSQLPKCWNYRLGATMPGTDHSYSLWKWEKNHFWRRNAANINRRLTQKSSAGVQRSVLGNESRLGSRVTHSGQRSFGTVQREGAHQLGHGSQRAALQGGAPCPFLDAHTDTAWPCEWRERV